MEGVDLPISVETMGGPLNAIIESNHIIDCLHGIRTQGQYIYIQDNVVRNTNYTGLYVYGGTHGIITGNEISDCNTSGLILGEYTTRLRN